MKTVILYPNKFTKKFVFSFVFTSLITLALAFPAQSIYAQQQQASLSLADLLIALRSKKATLAERNTILTEAVKQRGITFAVTPDIEKELEATGADKNLIEAVRLKSQIVKVSAVTTPKTEPIPIATPKPPDYVFYQNRANANFVKGDIDLAVLDYNKAIELNPKETSSYMSRASAFYINQLYDKAIADYDKVIELDPTNDEAYYKRAVAYEKTGEKAKAAADYQKTVELNEKNDLAKNSFQRLQAELVKVQPKPVPTEKPVVTEVLAVPKMVNVGSMKDLAIKLAMPVYPSFERSRKTEGMVTVVVEIDEEGKVTSVEATDGPAMLRNASEDAARKSKFKPALFNNKPIKARGFIVYSFKAQ